MSAELPDLNWLITIVREAGSQIKDAFYIDKKVNYKLSSADLLTETDINVEKFLVNKIKEKYALHQFLCEESSTRTHELSEDPTWVIDPVDGTTNFVHTFPFVAISIAFVVKRCALMGVIYNPIMNELFYATRGGHAWLINSQENQPIKLNVSQRKDINEALIATGFCASLVHRAHEEETRQTLSDADRAKHAELKEIIMINSKSLIENCRDIRRQGSCALDLAFVAAGRLDGSCELGVKEWDIAAGSLIVKEAGGNVTDYDAKLLTDIGKRQIISGCSFELCKQLSSHLINPKFNLRDLEC